MATSSSPPEGERFPPLIDTNQPMTIPTIVAGGGTPSSAVALQPVKEFEKPILSHLLSIHHKFYTSNSADTSFQDGHALGTDESTFLSYMSTPQSSAMESAKPQDLTYPLSSYFISSSHNTYLSGHQLYGTVKAEAYTNVLLRGCRCLEIDVWDGEDYSDTSSSSDEGRPRAQTNTSESKFSRWNSLKVKAKNRMRSRSRSRSNPYRNTTQDPVPEATTNVSTTPPTRDVPITAMSPETTKIQEVTSGVNTIKLDRRTSSGSVYKPEPMVLHGYTLTQGTPFRAVCKAIVESAFVTTDLPLIVSLEVHASLAQQETMVEIMKESWGKHLIDITGQTESDVNILPSPDSLRNKILIKVKWTPNKETGETNDPLDLINSNTTVDPDNRDEGAVTAEKKKKASKVLTSLSELGIYTRAYTFKTFKQPEANLPTHVFSLSESKVHDMHARSEDGRALFNHNKHYLMRVFPKGTRINSSNIDPTFHWHQGAQMVALNWQKLDRGMMINEGMFAGGYGWVLKPDGYRGVHGRQVEDGVLKSSILSPKSKKMCMDLELQLYAGQHIPPALKRDASSHANKVKPYVKCQLHVDIHGPPGQGKTSTSRSNSSAYAEDDREEEEKFKRTSQTGRSDCPDYGREILSWSNVQDVVEELSFLRLQVKDDRSLGKDDLLAWACIRLDRLREGYRFIHLLDATGRPSAGVLLVKISKRLS